MNPLAAALLAAQGWSTSDQSQQPNGRKSHQAEDYSAGNNGSTQANNGGLDMQALLGNPAMLQALSSQIMAGIEPQASKQPPRQPQPSHNDVNLTPGQTTRFGRVSRPPVAPPMQDQLALLQQMFANPNPVSEPVAAQQIRPARQPTQQKHAASAPKTSARQTNSNNKRPHSALRDNILPPQPQPPARPPREVSPMIWHEVSEKGGRPSRFDETSKDERSERRRAANKDSAADFRKRKELYLKSLEERVKEKEEIVAAKTEECEKWRQKFVDMEKQYAVLSALWCAAGYTLPNANGSMPGATNMPTPVSNPTAARPLRQPTQNAQGGLRNMPDPRNAPSMSPAAMNPPIRSPIPLPSATNTPNPNFPSPVQQLTPLAAASSTLAMAMPTLSNHPTMSPLTTIPASSPAETPDGQPFDLGIDMSAFDDFFNWDILPDNDADDQQDADFVPASSPKRDSDSDDESDGETPGVGGSNETSQKRKKRKTKHKGKGKQRGTGEDDDEFVDPEVDEEDLFMPITDVEVPPGQMQLVEKATQDVMSTFGVDSQVQLTGVMQKMVDAGDGLTGEQLEKMKSVLRWMQMSGHLPPGLQ